MVASYEWIAANYGWTPRHVEGELTDEQLLRLFEAASDRLTDNLRNEHRALVQGVRIGTIVASDRNAYRSWMARMSRGTPGAEAKVGLTGRGLERAVGAIRKNRPNLVAMPGMEVRRMRAHPAANA